MKILVNEKFNRNPHLSDTRLTVYDVVIDCHVDGISSVLERNSELTKPDLIEALSFCSNRSCDVLGGHCGGCSLRLSDDGIHSMEDFVNRFSKVLFVDSNEQLIGKGKGIMIMPGTQNDLVNTWKGVDGWILAKEVLNQEN